MLVRVILTKMYIILPIKLRPRPRSEGNDKEQTEELLIMLTLLYIMSQKKYIPIVRACELLTSRHWLGARWLCPERQIGTKRYEHGCRQTEGERLGSWRGKHLPCFSSHPVLFPLYCLFYWDGVNTGSALASASDPTHYQFGEYWLLIDWLLISTIYDGGCYSCGHLTSIFFEHSFRSSGTWSR